MTIKEAIDTLGNVVNTQTTDGNVKRKLSDTIKDLECYMNSPERGEDCALPESVARLIPNGCLNKNQPFNRVQAGRLQQAVLNMIHGWKSGLPNVFFSLTLVLTLIGIGFPLIWNCLSNDMWYFSIESAKDILGIIFDGGGAFCAFSTYAAGKKFGGGKSGTFGSALCVIGGISAIIAVVLSFVIPSYGFKIYGTIIAVLAMIFVFMGVMLLWREPKNNSGNCK